jgi:Rho-binding antiterminator
MAWITQASVGRCDFIDVLEEAVLRRRPTTLRLEDGSSVTATVVDVITRDGDDFVRLSDQQEIAVGRIAAIDRLEPAQNR